MEFIYMVQGETKSGHYFPDQPNVITAQEARGWKKVDPPEEKPFVPERGDIPVEQTWVTLYHPKAKAHHDFPNNVDALKGAHEAGWEFPELEHDDPEETDGASGKDRPVRKKTVKKDVSPEDTNESEEKK